jgi:hypothetical protein
VSDYMQGDKDNSVAVPFSDDESAAPENDNDEDSPSASPEERKLRSQRRAERITRLLQESKERAAKVKELEERDAKRERELAELRGAVAANQNMIARQQASSEKDPYESQLDAIYERQSRAYNSAQAEIKAGTMTPERQAYYEREAREIESAKTRVHTQRVVEDQAQRLRQESAQQVWVQKHPEVYQNPRAFEYAKATYQRRLALGEVATNSLVDEVMEETKAQFKLGAKPAPSASDRARMSGLPAAGSGGGGKSPSAGLPPELKRMALAAYSDLPEAEAVKKWEATTGKRLRAKKVI